MQILVFNLHEHFYDSLTICENCAMFRKSRTFPFRLEKCFCFYLTQLWIACFPNFSIYTSAFVSCCFSRGQNEAKWCILYFSRKDMMSAATETPVYLTFPRWASTSTARNRPSRTPPARTSSRRTSPPLPASVVLPTQRRVLPPGRPVLCQLNTPL